MKKACLLFFAVLFITSVSHAEDIDLFILAGQSNAQGWVGTGADYPKDPHGSDATIRFYWVAPGLSDSAGQWTTLQPQGDKYLSYFGPEVSFARRLKAAGYNPAIFKYSRGSTSIAQHWKGPGNGLLYDQMVYELKKALTGLEKEGHKIRVRGLVWIQGESDAKTPAMANAYQSGLKRLIDDFRRNVVRDPRLPVMLGVDEQHHHVKVNPQVVRAQQALAHGGRYIVFTSMLGLEKSDGAHLSPAGLERHGQRLYEAYQTINRGQ